MHVDSEYFHMSVNDLSAYFNQIKVPTVGLVRERPDGFGDHKINVFFNAVWWL